MSFFDIVQSDFDTVNVNSEFSQSVVYTPSGGSARSITVVVTETESDRQEERKLRRNRLTLQTFCSTDSETGIPSPAERDLLTVNGVKWNFNRVVSQDAAGVTIEWVSGQDQGAY